MNWILLLVVAIVGIGGYAGLKKGLVKMVFSVASTIAALLVAMLFSPAVAGLMKNNETIVSFFDEKISAVVDFTSEEAYEETEGKQQSLIASLPFPETFKEMILENNTVENYAAMQAENFEAYVCRQITNVIINAIAFVITLLLAVVVLAILCSALNLLAKLPLLKQVNATAGLAAGVLEGLLIIWIMFVILTMFAGSDFGSKALAMISDNPLLDFLYKNNVVSKFISRG